MQQYINRIKAKKGEPNVLWLGASGNLYRKVAASIRDIPGTEYLTSGSANLTFNEESTHPPVITSATPAEGGNIIVRRPPTDGTPRTLDGAIVPQVGVDYTNPNVIVDNTPLIVIDREVDRDVQVTINQPETTDKYGEFGGLSQLDPPTVSGTSYDVILTGNEEDAFTPHLPDVNVIQDSNNNLNNLPKMKLTLIDVTKGTQKIIECDSQTTILDAGENAGIDLFYSSRAGADSTCLAKLVSGAVDQSAQSYLVDDELAQNLILIDAAFPLSDCVIKVNYEGVFYGGDKEILPQEASPSNIGGPSETTGEREVPIVTDPGDEPITNPPASTAKPKTTNKLFVGAAILAVVFIIYKLIK
jgi:ferredoxin